MLLLCLPSSPWLELLCREKDWALSLAGSISETAWKSLNTWLASSRSEVFLPSIDMPEPQPPHASPTPPACVSQLSEAALLRSAAALQRLVFSGFPDRTQGTQRSCCYYCASPKQLSSARCHVEKRCFGAFSSTHMAPKSLASTVLSTSQQFNKVQHKICLCANMFPSLQLFGSFPTVACKTNRLRLRNH